jgi:hypothetical protein
MKTKAGLFGVTLLVGMVLPAAPVVRAQSYGPNAQVLTIGAAQFRSMSSDGAYVDSNQYLYYGGDDHFLAALPLPKGALVERLCLYANDSDPSPAGFVDAVLVATKLVPGGELPDQDPVGERVSSTADFGYGYYCSPPFSLTLSGKTDIDQDGNPDNLDYSVYVNVPQASQNSLGFGGVQIHWRRQVSAAPSTPTFGDVPPTDAAFTSIEALAASGITAGCAGGNYCPDAKLTRRQMAVFLATALGLHWSD